MGASLRVYKESELKKIQLNPSFEKSLELGRPAEDSSDSFYFPDGFSLTFGSTQPKKFYEIEQYLLHSGRNVRLNDSLDVLHWFHSADEVSKTYVGNTYEKIETLLERIYDDLGYEEVASRFKQMGIDPDEVVFSANDTGLAMDVDYSGEPEFKNSLHEKGYGPWPGVELGPVTDAQGGVKGFFSALKKMKERFEGEGKKVDLKATDYNNYLFFKLKKDRKDIEIISSYSETPVLLSTEPPPMKNNGVLTTYDFSCSLNSDVPKEDRWKTCAEMGDKYVGRYSAQAMGMDAFCEFLGIPSTSKKIFNYHADVPKTSTTYIATHHNIIPFLGGAKEAKTVRSRVQNSLQSGDTIVRNDAVDTTQNGAYQDLTKNASCVVLGRHDKKILNNYDEYFLDLFDLWTALHVDKQLRVETFEGRPLIVLNRQKSFQDDMGLKDLDWNDPKIERKFVDYLKDIDPKEDPWLAFISFNEYLHEKGFIKQEPRFLHDQLDPDDKKLKIKINKLVEGSGPKKKISHYAEENYGHDRNDIFEVTVLGSATTRVFGYVGAAEDFGYFCSKNGCHVRTGGGRYGIMGATARGVRRYMADRQEIINVLDRKPYVSPLIKPDLLNTSFKPMEIPKETHLSAIQMPRTIQFEGANVKQGEARACDDKFLKIADSFDSRMDSLFRSDFIVAAAPGIGTYEEIIRFMRRAEAGADGYQNKKIVILNSEQPDGGADNVRIFDAFLAMLPDKLREKYLIVESDIKGVEDTLLNEKKSWEDRIKERDLNRAALKSPPSQDWPLFA